MKTSTLKRSWFLRFSLRLRRKIVRSAARSMGRYGKLQLCGTPDCEEQVVRPFPRSLRYSASLLHKVALSAVLLLILFRPFPASACSACFGQTDSPLAAGLNSGIMFLIGIVLLVLGGFVAFFIYLARRASAFRAAHEDAAAANCELRPELAGSDPQWIELSSPSPL